MLSAEFIVEYENDGFRERTKLDEGIVNVYRDNWSIQFGRLYIPFGEFYSHFITGPILEFGETRSDALTIDFELTETIEAAATILRSKTEKASGEYQQDWSYNLHYKNEDKTFRAGVGYLSDLPESDEHFLEQETNRYVRRVAAWNTYLFFA